MALDLPVYAWLKNMEGEFVMTTIALLRWTIAAVHLLGLGLGLGAIWSRSRALKDLSDPKNIQRAIFADTLWGIAAIVWITTGLARAFAGLEKGSAVQTALVVAMV